MRGSISIPIIILFFCILSANVTPGFLDTQDTECCVASQTNFLPGDRNNGGSLTTFKDGSAEKDVWFSRAGFNDSVEITLPTGINITAASMVVEGKPLGGEMTREISFNDTVNSSAWWGGSGGAPVGNPSNYQDNAYVITSYVALKNRDDIRLRTQNVAGQYAYQHFSFHLPFNELTSFEVLYEGGGMAVPEMGFATSGIKLYIYHVSGSRWDQVDLFTSGEVWDERTLRRVYEADPGNYVDVSGNIHLVATTYVGGAGLTAWLDTDFVHLMVTGWNPDAYPTDPSLNVGSRGSEEWEHQGELTGEVTINDTHGFRASLQEILDDGQRLDSVNISFSLYSANPSIIGLKELMIEYDIIPQNQPPMQIDDISDGSYSFPEDTDEGIGLIDLYDIFDDDGGQDNLGFLMTMNHHDLTATVNMTSHSLDFTSAEDFFGVKEFQIRVTDDEGSHIDSDVFHVRVTPTNDPPYILEFDGLSFEHNEDIELTAIEDETSYFNFSTQDIDGDVPQFSFGIPFPDPDVALLRVSDENASCGTILVEPRNEDVGHINFSLVIDDLNHSGGSSLKTQYNVTVEVINTNDAPIIDEVDRYICKEDEWLNFTLTAGDPDLDNDEYEKLTFHTNFSNSGIHEERWYLDEETGNFSFLPDNSLVGPFIINFSVRDSYGKEDWTHAEFEVKNVNDPPIVKKIVFHVIDAEPVTTERENLTIVFSTEPADDPDLIHGDALSYLWDFDDGDGIDTDAMGMNVEWTYKRAGNYTVTLTVQDSGIPMRTNFTKIEIEVLAPAEPGEDDNDVGPPDDDTDRDGTGGKKNEGLSAGFLLLIIFGVLLVLGVCVALVIIVMRRGDNKESEDRNFTPSLQHGLHSHMEIGVSSPGPQELEGTGQTPTYDPTYDNQFSTQLPPFPPLQPPIV